MVTGYMVDNNLSLPTGQPQKVTNGKLRIWFFNEMLEAVLDNAFQVAETIDGGNTSYNCSGEAYVDAVDRLYSLAKDIVSKYPQQDIFSYIPLSKSGSFVRDKSILLADTDIINTYQEDCFIQKKLQLRLVSVYKDADFYWDCEEIKDTMAFEIAEYKIGDNTIPVFDTDNVPRIINKEKAVYPLSNKKITEGCVYTDINKEEFLYLGYFSLVPFYFAETEKSEYIERISKNDITESYQVPKYCYVRVTKKVKSMLEKSNSLQSFIDDYILRNVSEGKLATEGLSIREMPHIFIEEKEPYFIGVESMVNDHTIEQSISDADRFMCRIRPIRIS